MSTWQLADLVDIATLQHLAETLYRAVQIPVSILADDGRLLVSVGAQEICSDFHFRHPATLACCEANVGLLSAYRETARPLITKCQHHLRDMAYPLVVDGEYLATLVIGQFLFEDDEFDREVFRTQARTYGFADTAYLAAFDRVPRFSREQAQAIIEYYTILVNGLVSAGRNQRMLEERAEWLQSSEAHYRGLFESHQSVMLVIDTEQLIIVSANPAACDYYGYPREALVGQSITTISCLSQDQLQAFYAQLRNNDRRSFPSRHRTASGEVHDVEIYTGNIQINDRPMLFAIVHDISDEISAKQALATERERLAVTVQSMGDGVIATDADGRVTLMNSVAEALTAWSAADALGKPLEEIFNIVNEDTRMTVPNPVSRVLEEGCIVGLANHTVLIGQDGSERPIADSGAPIRTSADGEILGAVLVFRDQTEEREHDYTLRESEQRFRSLFASAVEGVVIHELVYDATGVPIDYRLLDMNPAFELHTGIKADDVCGKLATEAYVTTEPPYLDMYARVALTGEPTLFETYFPPMDRHFVVSVWAPAHGQFVTSFEDVTARKTAEAAVLEEKERLMVTLRSIGDGVITTDTDGCVVLMNRKAEELTGWRQDEAQGHSLTEIFNIIHEYTRQNCENPVDRVLRSGQIVELANHTALIARDGTERIIADSGAPIRNHASEIIGVVLVFRDVTLESHVHAEMQRMAKLDSLGVMAGGIAHDFNNLLTAISGNMGLAQFAIQANQPERLQRYLTEAENAAIRARDLTQQLLTFARGGAPVRRIMDPRPLIKEAVMFALTGSRCQSRLDLPKHLWCVNADAGQLAQVLHNLLLNADQAMPTGGTVRVAVENVMLDARSGQPLPPGAYLRVAVTDEGTGILPELREKIFDPFFTTKQRGSGLGLASVFSIIRGHDGHIGVESEVGTGSTFTIYLPAIATEAEDADQCGITPTHVQALRILILDDEAMIVAVLTEMLTEAGHEIVAVAEGEAAIAAWQEAHQLGRPFALGIFDLTIPGGMGGKEVISRLREIDPTFRAIASSGYATDPILAHFTDYGFSGRLAKPYRISEVLEAVAQAMAGSSGDKVLER